MSIGDAQAVSAVPTPESICGDGYTCLGCGIPYLSQRDPQRPNDRAVITGIDVDFDGVLVLCETCVKYLGSLVGMVDMETGKARTSDVRRSQRRDAAVRAAADARDTAAHAAAALQEALANLDEVLA